MAIEANLQLVGVSSSVTQPDMILPSQHFGPRRKLAPEQRLMIAVLHDATDCLEKYRFATGSHGRRLPRGAAVVPRRRVSWRFQPNGWDEVSRCWAQQAIAVSARHEVFHAVALRGGRDSIAGP